MLSEVSREMSEIECRSRWRPGELLFHASAILATLGCVTESTCLCRMRAMIEVMQRPRFRFCLRGPSVGCAEFQHL